MQGYIGVRPIPLVINILLKPALRKERHDGKGDEKIYIQLGGRIHIDRPHPYTLPGEKVIAPIPHFWVSKFHFSQHYKHGTHEFHRAMFKKMG